MKIGELSRRTGVSAHTLRYYERIGLLPPAGRDRSGQRDYDDSVLVWLDFLDRLRATGMPIRDRLRYARLRAGGVVSAPERRSLLVAHRNGVRARLTEMQDALRVLDAKIAGYGDHQQEDKPDATS